MNPRSFKSIGTVIVFAGVSVVTWLMSQDFINLAKREKGDDNWIWFLLITPIVFSVLGSWYLWFGVKRKNSNRWISASAIIQIVAVAIGLFGLFFPFLTKMEFGILLTLFLGIPTIILMAIGIIILIVGCKKESASTNKQGTRSATLAKENF